MRFVAYHDGLEQEKKISVDGFVPNALCLTHWPGNRTPAEFKADTTTEIVVRLLQSGRYEEVTRGYEIITNNHFDTDGVIPSWLLLHPDTSPDLFPKLVQAARAGDFLWMDDEQAAKFNFLVETYKDATHSPIRARFDGLADHEQDQLCYETLYPMMPGLLLEVERHRDLWQRDWDRWCRNREAAASAKVKEFPEKYFAVVEGDRFYTERALFNLTRMDRILCLARYADGWRCQFRYSKYCWYDVTRPHGARKEFAELARSLAAMESSREGRWVNETDVTTENRFTYRIPKRVFFGEGPNVYRATAIPPEKLVETFLAYFGP